MFFNISNCKDIDNNYLSYLENLLQTNFNKSNPLYDYFKTNFRLDFIDNKLSIQSIINQKETALNIDFKHNNTLNHRLQNAGDSEIIIKACFFRNKKKCEHIILDATAGLATDSLLLASKGAQIIMLERNFIISSMLIDALRRYYVDKDIFTNNLVINQLNNLYNINENAYKDNEYRLQLSHSTNLFNLNENFKNYLNSLNIDTIYLDPMYPHEKTIKSLVKKKMQYMQQIVGSDSDADQLLDAAFKINCRRIVVKRNKSAPHLQNKIPSYFLRTKSHRIDIYIN